MAGKSEVEMTYSPLDFIFRRSLGKTGDYSGALFDGDFTLSLEQAQRRKHEYIVESLGLKAGDRMIDLSCGWGPLLRFTGDQGISSIGLTLSSRQVRSCRRQGLEVYERDCRTVDADEFGQFDAIASVGGFEHFCSLEESRAGRQEEVYREFFANTATLLPVGKRFFLQTMVFGPNKIDYDEVRLDAPHDSDSYALALMEWGNPGSWLAAGLDQVVAAAAPEFKFVTATSGRVDYIETLNRWVEAFKRFDVPKYLAYATMLPKMVISGTLGLNINFLKTNPNRVCFERELMEHYRIVFERVA